MAKKLQEIVRGSGKKVVFTFGRFNPPTTGHEKLIDTVVSLARRNGAENRIYISNSQDARKNPLPPRDKKRFMSKAFPKANIILSPEAITPFHAFDILREEGFAEITMVVGSDRVTEFRNSIQKYMNKEGIKLDKFEVVSAGERDPDAEGVTGMSGSKLRELAQQGKMDTFMSGLPSNLQDADKKQIYNILRKEMGISESLDLTEQKEDEDESITVLVLTSSPGDFKGTIGR
jgi:nicotinamide mononucleotide adenylyltransferase